MKDSLNDILPILKEIKNKVAKFVDESMTKKEHKRWLAYSIAATIIASLITSGVLYLIYTRLSTDVNFKQKDYDINVTISPPDVELNSKGNIEFTFSFKNIGKKDIKDFNILEIDLFRLVKGQPTHLYDIYTVGDRDQLSCKSVYTDPNFKFVTGEVCTLKRTLYVCPECFNDKDKPLQVYVYIHSVPPIENKVVNISYY